MQSVIIYCQPAIVYGKHENMQSQYVIVYSIRLQPYVVKNVYRVNL